MKFVKENSLLSNLFIGVAKTGAYKYDDGTKYIGDWNNRGLKHGAGSLLLPDGTRYDGAFQNGLCSGLGIIIFPDGAKYVKLHIILFIRLSNTIYFFYNFITCKIILLVNIFRYEGEFMQGWFHGHGVFWRADGMKFEGEFRGGRVWGLGLY